MKIFNESADAVRGRILPLPDFRLLSDLEKWELVPEKMEGVVEAAEKLIGTEPIVMPLSQYRKYVEEGSVAAYSQYYMDRLGKTFRLGLAEAYERRGRFTETLIDYIWAWLEEASWVLPEHTSQLPNKGDRGDVKALNLGALAKVPVVVGEKYMHGLELGTAYLAADLALVYHLNKEAIDSVSPLIGERLAYELDKRIIRPYIYCDFWWEGLRGNRVNNWCPWIVSGVLLVMALTTKSMTDRELVTRKAIEHLNNFVNSYEADGGCEEGPTYWNAAGGTLFDCLEIIYDLSGGALSLFDHELIRVIGEYLPKVNISGRYFVNFADCGSSCVHDGNLLKRYGKKCNSPLLSSFADSMLALADSGVDYKLAYRTLRTLTTPRYEKLSQPKAIKETYFPNLKVMVQRESENANEGLFLAIKGGSNGEFHNHNDVGSFIVYYGGKPVLIDAGVGDYTRQTFSPQRYELWFMRSEYHNLPIINGTGEMQGAKYASKGEVYNPEERSLTLDISGAYPAEAGVTELIRSVSMSDGKITLTDSVTLKDGGEVDFIFMCKDEPRLEGDTLYLSEGRRLIFDRDRLTPIIEAFDPKGLNAKRMWSTDTLWRIHLKANVRTDSFTFTII